jgi:hypothetical protein
MITSADGQSPYNALIAATTTGRHINPPTEIALSAPDEAESSDSGFNLFGEDGFTFADLVDVVNPLQHIPLVSTMYREASEDTLDPGSRMMGSALFFGPIGLASSLVNVLIEESTGKDIGAHIASAIFPDDSAEDEVEVVDIAAFNTAAGTDAGKDIPRDFEQIDPVSAWAAREAAWVREQQGLKREPVKASDKASNQTLPDADSIWGKSYDELAALNPRQPMQALRNATWAYESAANLALDRA